MNQLTTSVLMGMAILAAPASASVQPAVAPPSSPATSGEDEVVVYGSHERSPYRAPEEQGGFDPEGTVESVLRERRRWMEGGDTGIGSCSNIGPGGWTGCDIKVIERAYQQGRRVGIGRQRVTAGISLGEVWMGTGSKP
jgi:hypothetical protein